MRASGGMVDTLSSGASALTGVEVQVLFRVPKKKRRSIGRLSFLVRSEIGLEHQP